MRDDVATLGLSETERQSIARLKADVIEPSMESLIILAFQSQRSPASAQMALILDKAVANHAGRGVRLVTIDVEKEPALAAQFQVQAIPTVYAIYHGQPVADLSDFRSESQVAKALEQILRQLGIAGADAAIAAEVGSIVDAGEKALDAGDADEAAALFATAHDMAPEDAHAAGGLARALVAAGRTGEARALIDGLDPPLQAKPEVARARAALDLAETPKADTAPIEARIAANPEDLEARSDLADALIANGDRDGGADALLAIIERDRDWNGGAARQKLLQLIEAQGLEDPWSGAQRRRLSAILFT